MSADEKDKSFFEKWSEVIGSIPLENKREILPKTRLELLHDFTISELVSELRKRDGVDAYDVSVNSDSRIILYGRGTEFIDTGTEKGAAIILRVTE